MSDNWFIRYARFPNNSAGALVVVNDDGTYDIYINTRRSPEGQRRALLHELAHIEGGHFDTDDISISAKEALARGEEPPPLTPPPPRRLKRVRLFSSPAALAEYLRRRGVL